MKNHITVQLEAGHRCEIDISPFFTKIWFMRLLIVIKLVETRFYLVMDLIISTCTFPM